MPARKRRRRQPEDIGREGGYRWLSAPVVLAFGLGAIVGMVLIVLAPSISGVFFFLAVFLVAFALSHMVGRRFVRRRALQRRAEEAASRPQAPQRTPGEG